MQRSVTGEQVPSGTAAKIDILATEIPSKLDWCLGHWCASIDEYDLPNTATLPLR